MILRQKGIIARCPGSCGELIQGMILGGEKLISYPINCYSYVRLTEGYRDNQSYYSKAYQALDSLLNYFGGEGEWGRNLRVDIQSEIPRGKGMASSTADLGATLLAGAKYLKREIGFEEMIKICLEIEPTDSTLFPDLTLFDHVRGKYKKSYEKQLDCQVLLLEGREIIDTLEFHNIEKDAILRENIPQMKRAIQKIETGIGKDDLKELGQGAILSALANEKILKKPGLEKVIKQALKFGAYGVNVAHSGSVLGILFEDKYFDKEAFLYEITEEDFYRNYIGIKEYKTVKGGPEIVDREE